MRWGDLDRGVSCSDLQDPLCCCGVGKRWGWGIELGGDLEMSNWKTLANCLGNRI